MSKEVSKHLVFISEALVILVMVDQLLSAVLAYQIEFDPPRYRMPLELEQSIKILGLLPTVQSQLHALFDDTRVVSRTYNVLKNGG